MEGSEPASLLIPVRPAATPGTGMCDTGLWLTPGEGTATGPNHGNPVQEGRIRLNGNVAQGLVSRAKCCLVTGWHCSRGFTDKHSERVFNVGIHGGGEE